jgi:hypothetical protein
MDNVKSNYREAEQTTRETARKADGSESVSDKIGNAGDELRRQAGDAGDDLRRGARDLGDDVRGDRDGENARKTFRTTGGIEGDSDWMGNARHAGRGSA